MLTGIREQIGNLREVFVLVPWRMRPKLIAMLVGAVVVALMDLAAVVLILPIMQIVSGTPVSQSAILRVVSSITGRTDPAELLVVILVTVVVLMLGKNVFTIYFRWWSLGVMARATGDASHELLSLYVSSPWIHQRRRSTDDVYQALTSYLPISLINVTSALITVAVDAITLLALLVALVVVSPLATLVAIVFFGGSAFVIQWALKGRVRRIGERIQAENHLSWGFITPILDGFKEVRLAQAGGRFTTGYSMTRRRSAQLGSQLSVLNELPRYLLEVVMILGIMVIALALFATSSQQDALAFLGVFAVAAIRMMPSLNRIVGNVGGIRANLPGVEKMAGEVRALRSEAGRATTPELPHEFPSADVVFTDVTFQFPDADEPVLQGVSGVIPAGKTVAFVGSSGAGKTTLVDLLLGLFVPGSGTIQVDGVSIHQHPGAWWKQLGVVTQNVYLQDASVRENIAFGVPVEDIDEERLREAIRLAQLEDVIARMPDGLATQVGYQGSRVSGGQKQRIGIARALYRQPQVLVLDEATSALDNETEARISQTIQSLHGTMTMVVVAHRLSTVRNADTIMFFSGGRIVARGTMEELVATNAEFAELVRLGRLA